MCILLDKFIKMFMNVKKIYVYHFDIGYEPSLVLSNKLLSSLIYYLSSPICLNQSTAFHSLIIIEPDTVEMTINEFIKNFNQQKNQNNPFIIIQHRVRFWNQICIINVMKLLLFDLCEYGLIKHVESYLNNKNHMQK